MQQANTTGPRANPSRGSPPSRSPGAREDTRTNETDAPTLDPPERRFILANTEVVVTITPIGAIARIEGEAGTEYGVLAPETVDALREVATAHE